MTRTTLHIAATWDGAPIPEAERATVTLEWRPDGLHIAIDAPRHDDPLPPMLPGPTPGLWNFEVVEVFVLGPEERYTEIEIGPLGHHLVLRLEGRRRPVAEGLPLAVSVSHSETRWQAEARLDPGALPPRPWSVNAFAIHGAGADRRYLAAHPAPGPQPDFHRLDAFAHWLD